MARHLTGTRITLFLPVNNAAEILAATIVTTDIRQQLGGITYSQFRQPVFTGYWVDNETIYRDRISLVIIDIKQDASSDDSLRRFTAMRDLVLQAYNDVGSRQLEVWVIASPILMVVGDNDLEE